MILKTFIKGSSYVEKWNYHIIIFSTYHVFLF